eukprot:Colp12_sorted_trinity150504_noHs@11709
MDGTVGAESVEGGDVPAPERPSRTFAKRAATRKSMVDYETAYSKASQSACYFNLTNTIIGSGILGLPYAYAASGWVLGSLFLMCSALASGFALHILSMCALKCESPSSYYSVAAKALPRYVFIIDAAVAINCFGTATSYLVVIGGLMPSVMQQFGATGIALKRELWVAIGFCIVTPLVCMRNLDSLRFTSTMSICFVVFLTLVVVLYSTDVPGMDPCEHLDDATACTGETTVAVVNVHTFQVVSIFIFGFNCHQNTFAITNEMANPTQERVNTVIMGAIGTAFTVYLTFAACGYHTFGSLVDSNILKSYPENYLTSMARVFVSLLVCFCYPLTAHPARRCVLSLLHNFDVYLYGDAIEEEKGEKHADIELTVSPMQGQNEAELTAISELAANKTPNFDTENPETTTEDNNKPALVLPAMVTPAHELSRNEQRVRFTYVTLGFLGLSLLIGMSVSDLGTVLAVCGATGSTTVSYILPGFFYYYTFQNEGPAWKRNLALAQGIIGLCIIPIGLTFIFI